MPAVSKKAAKNAEFENKPLRDTAFSAGPDEGVSISGNTTAEVANAVVGEDDTDLEDYIGFVIGNDSDEQLRSSKGKAFVNGSDDGGADLPPDLQYRFIVRRKTDRDGPAVTPWLSQGELRDADAAGTYPLPGQRPIIRGGMVIALQARRPGSSNSFTFSLANTTFKVPGQGGR